MEKEKEIEIDYNGKKEKITIKRLSFGDRNELLDSFMKIKFVGRETVTEVSYKQMVELALLKCIKLAPFPITIEEIRNLDPETGDFIYSEVDKLNRLSEIKKSD